MAEEFYSSQTRQVKTAMTLSSTALLLYAYVGRATGEYVKVAPGQFEIPSSYLAYILAVSAIYFTFSYFVSVQYDRSQSNQPELASLTQRIADELASTRKEIAEYLEASITEVTKHGSFIHSNASGIEIDKLNKVTASATEGKRPALERAIKFITQLQTEDYHTELRKNYREVIDKQKEGVAKLAKEFHSEHERLKKKTEGLAKFHNDRWEYQLPIAWSVFCLLAWLFKDEASPLSLLINRAL